MSSDDVPTVRPSGTIAVFEQTLVEAIGKLSSMLPSDDVTDLRREAVALRSLFRAWKMRTPQPEERAAAISRLMDLHRSVEELASRQVE